MRKRERTWKDEVRERVQRRRKTRTAGGLPLFEAAEAQTEPEAPLEELTPEPEASDDLPLNPSPVVESAERAEPEPAEEPSLEEGPSELEQADYEWPGLEAQPEPVERPATLVERISAASIDFICLAGLWAIILYFAGRISHAGLIGLRPAWKFVVTDLAFVAAFYATYFTGTTGQTLGKLVLGLRVVNTNGSPPGYLRALLRAALGVVGTALLFAGLAPALFDPAHRALHDRVFGTRVIKG